MGKTAREETSGGGEESRKVDPLSGERTLFLLGPRYLFAVKINTNQIGIGINENVDFFCATKLPKYWMGIVEFDSKILLVGGEKVNDDDTVAPIGSDYPFDEIMSREIYEVKEDVGNTTTTMTIAPSEFLSILNEGKGKPIVQKFDSKIFVLHAGPFFKYDEPQAGVFEVYDFYSPNKGWVPRSNTPFESIIQCSGSYIVNGYCRIGDKLYLDVLSNVHDSYVFNLKTEEWSKDKCFFDGKLGSPIPICSGFGVSLPGLAHEHQYVILQKFSFEKWPEFYALLFTQGIGFLCYQRIDKIFSLGGLEMEYIDCEFLELSNGGFCGLLIGPTLEGAEISQGPDDYYLVVSIFHLEVVAPLPSPHLFHEPHEINFLSVNLKSQQKFKISGDCLWPCAIGATLL